MENKTAEEFIREKIKQKYNITLNGVPMKGLANYQVNGEEVLRWAHEFKELFSLPSVSGITDEEIETESKEYFGKHLGYTPPMEDAYSKGMKSSRDRMLQLLAEKDLEIKKHTNNIDLLKSSLNAEKSSSNYFEKKVYELNGQNEVSKSLFEKQISSLQSASQIKEGEIPTKAQIINFALEALLSYDELVKTNSGEKYFKSDCGTKWLTIDELFNECFSSPPAEKELTDITDEDLLYVAKLVCYRRAKATKPDEIKYEIRDKKVYIKSPTSDGGDLAFIEITKDGVSYQETFYKSTKEYYVPNQWAIYQYLQSKGYKLPKYF